MDRVVISTGVVLATVFLALSGLVADVEVEPSQAEEPDLREEAEPPAPLTRTVVLNVD